MATPTINFKGFVYDDAGAAISGATINLYDKNTTTTSRASTTTNSSGYWAIAHTTNGEFDVQVTSGSSKRRIKFDDAIHLSSIDTQTLAVRGANGAAANMYLYADRGDAAGDAWRWSVADGGVVTFANNIADIDAYVTHITLTPNATVADSSAAFAGKVTVANTLTLSTVAAAGTDTDKFLVLDSSGNVDYRTGTQVLSDIGAGSSSISLSGSTDNTIATVTGANALAGEANLTFNGSALGVVGTLTVGVDDTGHDVKFFGASAGAFMLYDQSEDRLEIRGPSADATTSTGKLLLSSALTNINANDIIGKIEFQAPLEAGGTDAITVAAGIQAVAQSTFAADSNATDLLFMTGHSEAATEKFRFTSQGELGVGGANYGTDGQVLTSTGAGTAPAWEDAGGGGTISLVADGNIAAGAACYITPAGKAKQLVGGWTGFSHFYFQGADQIVVEYDPDNDKIMALADRGNASAQVADLSRSGTRNTVTIATRVDIQSSIDGGVKLVYDTNEDRFLATYSRSSTGKGYVLDIDPSDDSIDKGSEVQFDSSAVMQISMVFDDSQNRVLIAYQDDGNSDYGTAVVAQIDNSDNSYTVGTPVVFESAETLMTKVVHDANANKNVIFYTDGGDSDKLKAVVATIDNTDNSVTYGTVADVDTVSGEKYTQSTCGAWYDASAQKVVVTWTNASTNLAYAKVGTISGTSISFGSLLTFGDSDTAGIMNGGYGAVGYAASGITNVGADRYPYVIGIGGQYDPDNNCSAIVMETVSLHGSKGRTDERLLYAATGTISGTTLSTTRFGLIHPDIETKSTGYFTAKDLGNNEQYQFDMTYDTNKNQVVLVLETQGHEEVAVLGTYPYENNMQYFAGFNTAAVSDGATATITVSGGINENQSSLTVGNNYYIDQAGTLIPSQAYAWLQPAFPRYAGVATAATKLLVHGDVVTHGAYTT